MPGVSVTTTTRSGPSPELRTPSGQYFCAGITERGSITAAIAVRGMADAEAALGPRVTYGAVHDSLSLYFAQGGELAYVARVVGPSASVGTKTLNDRDGTPDATLRVDAANPGAWSANLKVEVANGSLANTFKIIVTLSDVVVQTVNNIPTPAAAVQKFQNSEYIRVVDLGSATAAPNNNPAVSAAAALTAGADDRASITSTHYTTALALFLRELGDGMVAVPGQTASAVWTGLNTHCENNNRLGAVAAVQTAVVADLITRAVDVDSEYVGLFAPWVIISDNAGGQRTVSPEGLVAGLRARAHDQVGPWRAPAGAMGIASSLLGLDKTFTATEGDQLNDGRVNAIRAMANTYRLYGWRSLSTDEENYRHLHYRDTLNYLVVRAEQALERYVFEPIDSQGHLLALINGELVALAKPLARDRGLYARYDDNGDLEDPGYVVDTGSALNTTASLATNTIKARLSVRISPVGELIVLNIVKVGLLAAA